MPFNQDLDELARIADAARAEPGLGRLGDYCAHRGAGLRKPALADMTAFLADAGDWPFQEKRRAVRWIVAQSKRLWDPQLLVSAPLITQFLVPVLREWVTGEPDSAEAHYLAALWCPPPEHGAPSHRLYFLRRAMALDPNHDGARQQFVYWMTGAADYNQHELPWGYLGDVVEDLTDLAEARSVAEGVGDPELRQSLLVEIAEYVEIASQYTAWRKSRVTLDFASWCRRRDVLPRYHHWAEND